MITAVIYELCNAATENDVNILRIVLIVRRNPAKLPSFSAPSMTHSNDPSYVGT